jgi:hypothetical protein
LAFEQPFLGTDRGPGGATPTDRGARVIPEPGDTVAFGDLLVDVGLISIR